jgi:hypothetical protein
MLTKEIKEDTKNGEDSHVHKLEESLLFKMPIVPKMIYRFSVTLIRIPMIFFKELEE